MCNYKFDQDGLRPNERRLERCLGKNEERKEGRIEGCLADPDNNNGGNDNNTDGNTDSNTNSTVNNNNRTVDHTKINDNNVHLVIIKATTNLISLCPNYLGIMASLVVESRKKNTKKKKSTRQTKFSISC